MLIRSMKGISVIILTVGMLVSLFPLGFSESNRFSLSLEVYYVDGGQFIDEVRGRYLIKYGLLSTAEIFREIVSSITDWNIKYPVEEPIMLPYISFDGLFNNLSMKIAELVGVEGEYFHVSIFNDIIFISTSSLDTVLDKIELNRDLITTLYIESLNRYLVKEKGLKMTLPDIVRGLGGSVKVVLFEIPNQGYEPTNALHLADRFDELRSIEPNYIGGFGYDPIYGLYHFLIYLSCDSGEPTYEYSLDEVLNDIDSYLYKLFEGDPPTMILEVLKSCPAIEPLPHQDGTKLDDADTKYDDNKRTKYEVRYSLISKYDIDLMISIDDDMIRNRGSNYDEDNIKDYDGLNDSIPFIWLVTILIPPIIIVSYIAIRKFIYK